MVLKFYETPFHAIDTPEIASKNVLKADLMIMIRDIIEQQNWSHSTASEKLGVNQDSISDLIDGEIDNFTLDTLFLILGKLGFKTEFTHGNLERASIEIQKISLSA